MYMKIGFIGSGNMSRAIIGGIIKSGCLDADSIYVSNPDISKTKELTETYGIRAFDDNTKIVECCDAIVLAVKPHIYKVVLNQIKDFVREDTLIITIAAGITIDYVKGFFDKDIKVIRTMPNTPALVGEGMTALTYKYPVTNEDSEFVKMLFSSFGLVEIMDETYIDAFSSLCGASPAFVDMFIEAMADAAVLLGLPRSKSYMMAAQAVKGAAKMILETEKHPGMLKDMVCSPGGTTIEGVRTLEKLGLRSAVMEAVIASAEKAKKLV